MHDDSKSGDMDRATGVLLETTDVVIESTTPLLLVPRDSNDVSYMGCIDLFISWSLLGYPYRAYIISCLEAREFGLLLWSAHLSEVSCRQMHVSDGHWTVHRNVWVQYPAVVCWFDRIDAWQQEQRPRSIVGIQQGLQLDNGLW